ncbi:hypothetical protein Dimus_010575, partial [Dionaea muscipula]
PSASARSKQRAGDCEEQQPHAKIGARRGQQQRTAARSSGCQRQGTRHCSGSSDQRRSRSSAGVRWTAARCRRREEAMVAQR